MFRKHREWDFEKYPVGSDEYWHYEEKMVWNTRRYLRLRRIKQMIFRNLFRNRRWSIVLAGEWWNTFRDTY